MKKRPIAPLIEALKSLGARFEFLNGENCYPFIIKGARNANTCIEVDISKSSQYLSALLISAVCAGRKMKICANGEHGADYIHMTEHMKLRESIRLNAIISNPTFRARAIFTR